MLNDKGGVPMRKTINLLLPPSAALFPFVMMNPTTTQNDPDTFFHIEMGRAMLQKGSVIHEAIHTFAGNHLPYVSHEAGFQLVAAALYQAWGWRGLHVLTVFCLGLLIWGFYRLVAVSRKEMGLTPMQPFFVLFIPVIALYIYFAYFKIRPQMLSAPLIVWFVVWLREFQLSPNWKKAFGLAFLSFVLANVHAGVWPVIAVFYGIVLLESVLEKKLTRFHFYTLALIGIGALLNTGGIQTLLYFHTVGKSGFSDMISEWQPINFAKEKPFFITLLLFFWSGTHSAKKSVFRAFFFIAVLYLGVTNYKEHLYLMLFVLYFLAISIESVPWLQTYAKMNWLIKPKFLTALYGIGLLMNLVMGWMIPYHPQKAFFPVEEMNFILSHHPEGRPKVLASYVTSGYVMFRGGDILADGRFDPFVTEQTKGLHHWTAFEQSLYAFESNEVIPVVQQDHPDYLIMPKTSNPSWELEDIALSDVHRVLGQPQFVGSYGEVYEITKTKEEKDGAKEKIAAAH
jgi:hypothetical protein